MKKLWVLAALTLCGALAAESAADREAAVAYLHASGTPQTLKRAFDALLAAQFRATPELEAVRPELTCFFAEAFAFEKLKDELAKIYLKHYTVAELKQLTAFYSTPLGRKKARVDGLLTPDISQLIQQRTRRAIPQLQQILQQKMTQNKEKRK